MQSSIFSFVNIVTFIFGIIGIVIPMLVVNFFNRRTGIINVLCTFFFSIIAASIVQWIDRAVDPATIFIRVFLVIGLSQIIVTLGTLELYKKLELQLHMQNTTSK